MADDAATAGAMAILSDHHWADPIAGLRAAPGRAPRRGLPVRQRLPGCQDGFFHAYWRRPHAYLDERVRRATSVWDRLGPVIEGRAVSALRADLATSAWQDTNRELIAADEADFGARLLVTR